MSDSGQFQNILNSLPARSLSDLQVNFTDNWFPGGEAFTTPIIRMHDAAHQWANISPTDRGELQQQIVDLAGTKKLYDQTNARGFVNSVPLEASAAGFTQEALDENIGLVKYESERQAGFKGPERQRMLPVNDPARLQTLPLTDGEIDVLKTRGQQFYGLIGDSYLNNNNSYESRNVDPDLAVVHTRPNGSDFYTNVQADWMHSNGDLLKVPGGYDNPGAMPFGPYEARLNRPLQYTVDKGVLLREADKYLSNKIKEGYYKPLGNPDMQEGRKRFASAESYGLPKYPVHPDQTPNIDWKKVNNEHRNQINRTIRGVSGDEVSALQYALSANFDQYGVDALSDVASNARDAIKVKNAIRTGAAATGDVVGSIPLFDPEFRSSVERGDIRGAAKTAATDYALGAATAPVVGAGAGVLQRVAPGAAARVLPAVAAGTRVGNPIAVVSQIGGDSRQTQAQVIADRQAAEAQRLRAVQARERGNSWNIGPVRIPTFGIPESGGLFLGGNSSDRPIGTQSTLNGKPVLWSGDSYGWQSPQSAAKLGVTNRPASQSPKPPAQSSAPVINSIMKPLGFAPRASSVRRNRRGGG